MGYMRHHAIVVSTWNYELLKQAYALAKSLGMSVSNITVEVINGYKSFLVAPDGSKEGWDESNLGDKQRKKLIKWMDAQRYEDDSTSLDWVVVQFGDEEHQTKIINDSDKRYRKSHG